MHRAAAARRPRGGAPAPDRAAVQARRPGPPRRPPRPVARESDDALQALRSWSLARLRLSRVPSREPDQSDREQIRAASELRTRPSPMFVCPEAAITEDRSEAASPSEARDTGHGAPGAAGQARQRGIVSRGGQPPPLWPPRAHRIVQRQEDGRPAPPGRAGRFSDASRSWLASRIPRESSVFDLFDPFFRLRDQLFRKRRVVVTLDFLPPPFLLVT